MDQSTSECVFFLVPFKKISFQRWPKNCQLVTGLLQIWKTILPYNPSPDYLKLNKKIIIDV